MYISNEARIIRESSHGYDLIPIQDEMLSHREVELVGEVDAASVNALARQLRYLQRQDPEGQITLFINSPGGSALKLKAVSDDLMETRQIIARVISEHSGKSMEEVLAKTATDSYFRAEEAIEFGLADNIIRSKYSFL